jgi:hypothetical protein
MKMFTPVLEGLMLYSCYQHELYKEQGVNSGAPGGGEYEISVQLVTFLVFL